MRRNQKSFLPPEPELLKRVFLLWQKRSNCKITFSYQSVLRTLDLCQISNFLNFFQLCIPRYFFLDIAVTDPRGPRYSIHQKLGQNKKHKHFVHLKPEKILEKTKRRKLTEWDFSMKFTKASGGSNLTPLQVRLNGMTPLWEVSNLGRGTLDYILRIRPSKFIFTSFKLPTKKNWFRSQALHVIPSNQSSMCNTWKSILLMFQTLATFNISQ